MFSHRGFRGAAVGPILLAVTVLLAGATISAPDAAACCMVRASCCPEAVAPRDAQNPGMSAPLSPCCRHQASAAAAPQGDRPIRVPCGKAIAMISVPSAPDTVLPVGFITSTPPTTPIATPEHDPPEARAPPLA